MITSNHLEHISSGLESEEGFSHPELYVWIKGDHLKSSSFDVFRWKYRYSSLRQDTVFFKNIHKIVCLLFESKSEDEFLLKLDLLGVPREASDFIICYIWLSPCRWFSHDKRDDSDDVPLMNEIEQSAWKVFSERFKLIDREHLPILEVEEFLKLKEW